MELTAPGVLFCAAAPWFLYDPRRPVPSLGGRVMLPSTANAAGPVDQRPVEARDDVLCFTSPVLTEPLEVTRHVSLMLHVSSAAPDTGFTGKLVDVFPDGRAIFLTDGTMRARYRRGTPPEVSASCADRRRTSPKAKEEESTHSPPLSTYSALGGLRQDPGRAA
jgi:putative CocE/NonD family hydrolase